MASLSQTMSSEPRSPRSIAPGISKTVSVGLTLLNYILFLVVTVVRVVVKLTAAEMRSLGEWKLCGMVFLRLISSHEAKRVSKKFVLFVSQVSHVNLL